MDHSGHESKDGIGFSRTETINRIIANRQPFATKAEVTVENLRLIDASLSELNTMILRLQRDVPEDTKQKLLRVQSKIPLLQAEITTQQSKLQELKLRFSRSTLNIGIVGNARQGKSTFLQALTGLTSEEIPAAEIDHCTGAPSLIINHGESYADIEFFSENVFLQETVIPFYQQLSLSPHPTTFAAFVSSPLATPTRKLSATEEALYEKLRHRHESVDEYKSFLGKPTERIAKDKIRSYIAQQSSDGTRIATWLAVKMATIYCPFTLTDAGSISVCDTPGLGDFVCGEGDALAKNIGKNLDAVLMLKRTPKGGIATPEDTQLYDLLNKALEEFDPKDWSYFVINRDGTDNETKSFEKQIAQKIQCRKFITLDARRQEDVLFSFDDILQDIADNQPILDATLSDLRFQHVSQLENKLNSLLDEAKTVLPKSVGGDGIGMAELRTLFDPLWNNVAQELTALTSSYRESRDKSGKLNQQVDQIHESVLSNVRKRLESIQPSDFAGQKLPQFSSDLFHELRVTIAMAFDKLDDDLAESIDTLRSEVCDVFWESGRLSGIFDQSDPQLWLRDLASAWRSIDNGSGMAAVIERFANTGFTFRGYLLAKVRSSLDPLDEEEQESIHYRYAIGNSWEDVRLKLWSACNVSVDGCCKVLKGMSVDKNGALFSCNEQFTDGVLRLGGWHNAQQLWANFYDEYKSEIWSERFAKIEVNKALRRDWDGVVSKLNMAIQNISKV